MEAKEVQTQAWLAAAAGAELRGPFCFGDCLCFEYAHVGANRVSAAVLFRLWLHGHDESAANREWQTSDHGFGDTGEGGLKTPATGVQSTNFSWAFSLPAEKPD